MAVHTDTDKQFLFVVGNAAGILLTARFDLLLCYWSGGEHNEAVALSTQDSNTPGAGIAREGQAAYSSQTLPYSIFSLASSPVKPKRT